MSKDQRVILAEQLIDTMGYNKAREKLLNINIII